jgi:histidyl-tRNA synthetase
MHTEVYFEPKDGLGKQLKYASSKGIPAVIIAGPDEVAAGNVTVRDMLTGEQKTVQESEAPGVIKAWNKACAS